MCRFFFFFSDLAPDLGRPRRGLFHALPPSLPPFQILANLYHNCSAQKTLIVTHSNAALNDVFQKLMERDVLERHLLRLGSGVERLAEFTGERLFVDFTGLS